MDIPHSVFALLQNGQQPAGRQHRFMESADINAAFRALFGPLRTAIRRGMSNEGQIYGIEMDACVPGELLGTDWIPPATRGVQGPAALADPARRRAVFDRLLADERPEALFAYVCERALGDRLQHLYLEIVSADGCFAAEYPIRAGQGWRRRELLNAPYRRLDPIALS
jgi:hypothetical protein